MSAADSSWSGLCRTFPCGHGDKRTSVTELHGVRLRVSDSPFLSGGQGSGYEHSWERSQDLSVSL